MGSVTGTSTAEIERDAEGHVTLAETSSDAKVRTLKSTVRFAYELEVELGRMLGMIIRGPLVDALRGQLVSARAKELKERVEGGG